jgi:hypothetical protein
MLGLRSGRVSPWSGFASGSVDGANAYIGKLGLLSLTKIAFRLSCELSVFASLAGVAILVFGIWYRLMGSFLDFVYPDVAFSINELAGVDFVHRHPPMLSNSTPWGEEMGALIRYIPSFAPLHTFFQACFLAYIGLSWRSVLATVGAVAATTALMVALYVSGTSKYSLEVLNLVFLFAALKLVCPSDSRVPRMVLTMLLVVMVGYLFMFANVLIRPLSSSEMEDGLLLVKACIISPVIREIGRFLTVQCAWYLAVDAEVAGTGAPEPHRKRVLPLVMWFGSAGGLIYRLMVPGFKNQLVACAVVLFQDLIEIALRLTALRRDSALKEAFRRLSSCLAPRTARGRRHTAVFAPQHVFGDDDEEEDAIESAQDGTRAAGTDRVLVSGKLREVIRAETGSTAASLSSTHKEFRARIIIADMLTEYGAMYAALVTILWNYSRPLEEPHPVLKTYAGIFDGQDNTGKVVAMFVFQLVTEIITDSICIVFELRGGINVAAAWRKLTKLEFAFWFSFAAFTGNVFALAITSHADNLTNCLGLNMCVCAGGNGLDPTGVRQAYCTLLYPNSTGGTPY